MNDKLITGNISLITDAANQQASLGDSKKEKEKMESDDEDAALLSQLISSQTHGESSQVTLLTLSIDLILVVIFISFPEH
jgi:hypothetical protein